jgi:hypothetical protein
MWRSLVLLPLSFALASMPRPLSACSGGAGATLSALPKTGATAVSRYTSIIVAGGSTEIPVGLSLEANGQSVTLPALEFVGDGMAATGFGRYFRLRGALEPSTEYVLRGQDGGQLRELTRFTTAAGYDKAPGAPPNLERLRLWRVHYPPEQVRGGSCVFDEIEGYVAIDYTDGALPGTPADEIVHVLSLRAQNGTELQSFVFSGVGKFEGAPGVDRPDGGADLSSGSLANLPYAPWKPTLAPDRVYCATLSLYGRNDQAMVPVASNTICAPVMNVDTRPTIDAGPTADAGAGGVSGAGGPEVDAAPAALAHPGDGCSCSIGRGGAGPAQALTPVVLGLLAASRRARTRRACPRRVYDPAG